MENQKNKKRTQILKRQAFYDRSDLNSHCNTVQWGGIKRITRNLTLHGAQ